MPPKQCRRCVQGVVKHQGESNPDEVRGCRSKKAEFVPNLKRRIKVSQTKTEELEEKESFHVQEQRPEEGFSMAPVKLSSLVLPGPPCSWGRRGKLSWPERGCTELRAGSSCLGEWEMEWTKNKEEDWGARGPRRPEYFSGTHPCG